MSDRFEVPIAGGLDVPLPRMARVRQTFDPTRLDDVASTVRAEMERPDVAGLVKPGQRIAVGCGSRGVANIAETAKTVVDALERLGAEPFIFPAMGSHGGATALGQTGVLANYGITEAAMGVPVRSTMDTVVIGELDDGTPIHVDRYAHEADGIVLINRIKPHTTFRADIESGIVKMIGIGMGKHEGATALHFHGMDRFGDILPKVAEHVLANAPFLFGIGLVENAYDETVIVEAIPAPRLFERECELQADSKARMGRIFFHDIDVLVIDRMGKEISGAGFDPNITGRNSRGVEGFDDPLVNKIVVLDLTDTTHGNATGLGVADVITRRLFDRIDYGATWANVITSNYLDGGTIPIVMHTAREAVALGAKTALRVESGEARIVRIRDTLTLGTVMVSEPMLAEVAGHPYLEAIGELEPFAFTPDGRLEPIALEMSHAAD
jgi:hypothetical protein